MNILFDFRCKITAFSPYITYADFGICYQFRGKCLKTTMAICSIVIVFVFVYCGCQMSQVTPNPKKA